MQDLGNPPNKVYATLDVCVTDYNDNPPVFISPQHNITIRVPEVFIVIYFNLYKLDIDLDINIFVGFRI